VSPSASASPAHSRSSSHAARVRFSYSPVVRATRRGPTAGACRLLYLNGYNARKRHPGAAQRPRVI
jgi:hypothetical protein